MLIILGFVYTANLKWQYLAEFCLTLPSVTALWDCLLDLSDDRKGKYVLAEDCLRLLAAILELPAPEILPATESKRRPSKTRSDLILRNDKGKVIFEHSAAISRFSAKYVFLKENYMKNRVIRV